MAESVGSLSSTGLQEMDARVDSPAAMMNYVQVYLSVEHRDALENGCLMTALAGENRNEASSPPGFFQTSTGGHWQAHGLLSKRHARRDSIRMISAMVGAIVLARAVADEGLSIKILDHVKSAYR